MHGFPALAMNANVMLFLFPLAIVISLVYSASRYELPEAVMRRAVRLFFTILAFMAVVLGVLILLSRNL